MAGSDPGVRWMSYAEAARTLRVTPESLHRRMRRNGWARREGNDGKPRVAVPIDVLRRFDPVPDAEDGVPDLILDGTDGEAAALRDALARERERADKAEGERDAARAEIAAERARAATAEREREEARIRAAAAEGEAKGLREALVEASSNAVHFASWIAALKSSRVVGCGARGRSG